MNKLLMQWKEPFEVVDKMNPYDYKVNIHGKIKTFNFQCRFSDKCCFYSSECYYVSVEFFVLYRLRWFGFQNNVSYFSYNLCRIR